MENINIANNFVYSIITTLVTGIVNVAYPLIIGIIFDSSIMGHFSILFSWVALLAIPISNGIAPSITRFTAAENKNKSKQILKTGIQTTSIYGILVLAIFPLIGLLVLDMKILDLILIIGLILSTIFHYVFRRYLQGLEQLPESGELLIITKSLKDVMVLYKYGYTSVAPQSENATIPKPLMEDLKKRFKHIIVFFDYDNGGIKGAEALCKRYNLNKVFISKHYLDIYSIKDISDFAKEMSKQKTIELLKELFNGKTK